MQIKKRPHQSRSAQQTEQTNCDKRSSGQAFAKAHHPLKSVLSLSLALMFVGLFSPIQAYGQDGDGAGDGARLQASCIEKAQLGAQGVNSVQAGKLNQSTTGLYARYAPVLFSALNGFGEFSNDYRACAAQQWNPEYFLCDFNLDGAPELFVRTQSFANTKIVHVYTERSGNLVSWKTYLEGNTGTLQTTGGKLFTAGWDNSAAYVSQICLSGDEILSKCVLYQQADYSAPIAHIQAINDYLTQENAQYLSFVSVQDYSYLEANAKYDISKTTLKIASAGAYTGQKKTPQMNLSFQGRALWAGHDYTAAYKNNINAGTAQVIITGIEDFKGSLTGSFTIEKATNPLAVHTANKTASETALKQANKSVKCMSVSKGQGKISYKNMSTKAVAKHCSVNTSSGIVVIKKGAGKGTYKTKVQVNAAGSANFKAVQKLVNFKVIVK